MQEIQQVKGCCPLDCQDTCAWVADVEDGRVTRVRGARDHAITCAKVNDYEARIYAPDRLLHPMRRTGKKGSGTNHSTSRRCPPADRAGQSLCPVALCACMPGGHWRLPGGGLFLFDAPAFDEFAAGRADISPGEQSSLDLSALGPALTDADPAIKALMVCA